MVTTNTSDRVPARFLLRLTDIDASESHTFRMHPHRASRPELTYTHEGTLHESHRYAALLITNCETLPRLASFSINGEDELGVFLNPLTGVPDVDEEAGWSSYQLVFEGDKKYLFNMVYGLARIMLSFESEGVLHEYETLDITCRCERADYEEIVAGMLRELSGARDRTALDWMLSGGVTTYEGTGLVEVRAADDAAQPFEALVALVQDILRVYRRHLHYFYVRGHGKTVPLEKLVSPKSVRRLGRGELMWLAQNPDQLYETAQKTAIHVGGKYYLASRVKTDRRHTSFDNLENRALIAFAKEISRVLGRAINEVEADVVRLQGVEEELKSLGEGEGILPSLVVARVSLQHELPLLEKARKLQREARGVFLQLQEVFPDVVEVPYKLPRRTKVFQEIIPYADMHACMRRWAAFGRVETRYDTLALNTFRIDKLYEYYVLFKLLTALREKGFELDKGVHEPAFVARYSLEAEGRDFRNETQVATVYKLARGEEKLTVYYQPVIYGDEREEYGIDLHRLTPSRNHPFWTPDYMIVREREGVVQRMVIDAKFRHVENVHWIRALSGDTTKRTDYTTSAFLDCLLKYKMGIGGAPGVQVDAMWVVFARGEEKLVHTYQQSAWAQSAFEGLPDGVASASPQLDCVSEMLDELGIEGEGKRCSRRERREGLESRESFESRESREGCGGLESRESLEAREGRLADSLRVRRAETRVREKVEAADITDAEVAAAEAAAKAESEAKNEQALQKARRRYQRRQPLEQTLRTKQQRQAKQEQRAAKQELRRRKREALPQYEKSASTKPATSIKRLEAPFDEETLALVSELVKFCFDKELLFKADFAQLSLGITHPLLKKSRGKGREAKWYTPEAMQFNEVEGHVFCVWRPDTKNKLKQLVARYKKSQEAAEATDASDA
jgi:hypothetical protein